MKKNKSLEIIKYNKRLQKRLNLSINDYKEYNQLYIPIEIELKIDSTIDSKFINISDEDMKYYHIYLDNSPKEIKRNYLNKKEKVKIINIRIDYQVNSFKKLFNGIICLISINVKKFYRNNITDMSDMFCLCTDLKEINLSNFNTSNVKDMSHMFFMCTN